MGYSSYQGLAGGGGGSGLDPMGDTVSQPGNTFGGLEWVRHDGTQWLLAQANTETNAEAIGIVTEIITPGDSFKVKQIGQIQSLSALNPACPYLPLVPGRAYFLSETDGGQITLAEPKDTGTVSKPCLFSTGVDSCFIYSYRGLINDTYQNNGGTIPPGGGGGNTQTFTQPGASIDFAPGDLVTTYDNGGVGEFRLADNRDFNQSQVVGMVSATNVDGNPDKFNVQSGGYADFLGGLNRGTLYYLGEDGKMTDTKPAGPNVFVRPVFMSKDDEDGYVLDQQSINNAMSSEAGGTTLVMQPNAFWAGAVVRNDIGNNAFVLAQADSIQNATTAGIVTWTDGNAFIVQQSGWANITHYSNQPGDVILPGQKYWLSATNAGYMTPIEPIAPGLASKLMYISNTNNFGQIQEQRPMLQPYANGGGGGGGGGSPDVNGVILDNVEINDPVSEIVINLPYYPKYNIVVDEFLSSYYAQTICVSVSNTGGATWVSAYYYFSTNLGTEMYFYNPVPHSPAQPFRGSFGEFTLCQGDLNLYPWMYAHGPAVPSTGAFPHQLPAQFPALLSDTPINAIRFRAFGGIPIQRAQISIYGRNN